MRYEDKAYKELSINFIVGHKDCVLTAKDLQKDLERLANVGFYGHGDSRRAAPAGACALRRRGRSLSR